MEKLYRESKRNGKIINFIHSSSQHQMTNFSFCGRMLVSITKGDKHVNEQKETGNTKYCFPQTNLLNKSENKNINVNEIQQTAIMIQQTLLNFGVEVEVSNILIGPRFTRYEITPKIGVRIKDITRYENEIKMTAAATNIHIEAPILGKMAIGIDISNRGFSTVPIREMIESKEFIESCSHLAVAIGRDITGKIIVDDIGKMPHLLISGTTGSGKTVCINSIIMSVLYKSTPYEVRMIMIDTKGVSLGIYNGLPHLIFPVLTHASESISVLRWVVSEINDRYAKFANYRVRDLRGYNTASGIPCRLPKILIIIDDLSDLMALYKSEAEQLIAKIARISGSAGIHLIIATQRPSTDVVTGLIKSNIMNRIAFSVFSAIDSRVILDEKGAEELLGNGDMLFKTQGHTKPIRIQGTFVSDAEVQRIVDFWLSQARRMNHEENISGYATGLSEKNHERDEHFTEAARIVVEKNKASVTMLQRVFKIGFNRAERIIHQLEMAGIIEEENGINPRKVLVSQIELETILSGGIGDIQVKEAKKEETQKDIVNAYEKEISDKEETNKIIIDEKAPEEIIIDEEVPQKESENIEERIMQNEICIEEMKAPKSDTLLKVKSKGIFERLKEKILKK